LFNPVSFISAKNFRVSLRRADPLDPQRVERITEHEVVFVRFDLGPQAFAMPAISEREPAPVEHAHIETRLKLVREMLQPRLELLREQLLRALVLDQQDRHGPRNIPRRIVDAGGHVQEQIDGLRRLPVAAERTEQNERVAADDRPSVLARQQRLTMLTLAGNELAHRERENAFGVNGVRVGVELRLRNCGSWN
jgi:hypothetical protein